jgi:hypothetical protein
LFGFHSNSRDFYSINLLSRRYELLRETCSVTQIILNESKKLRQSRVIKMDSLDSLEHLHRRRRLPFRMTLPAELILELRTEGNGVRGPSGFNGQYLRVWARSPPPFRQMGQLYFLRMGQITMPVAGSLRI